MSGLPLQVYKRYLSDPDFAALVRLPTTLAFIPEAAVPEVWDEMAAFLEEKAPELADLLSYPELNFIGARLRRG